MAPTESAAYKRRTVKELQAELKKLGLDTKGTKAKLWDRLAAASAQQQPAAPSPHHQPNNENVPPQPAHHAAAAHAPVPASLAPMAVVAPTATIAPTAPLLVQIAPPPPPPPADFRHLHVRVGASRATDIIAFDCTDKQAPEQVAAALRSLVGPAGVANSKDPEYDVVYLTDARGDIQPLTQALLSQCPTPNDPADQVYYARNTKMIGWTVPSHRRVVAALFTAVEVAIASLAFVLVNLVLGTQLSVFDNVFLLPRLGLGATFELARSLLGASRVDSLLALALYALSWLVASAYSSRAYRVHLVWWLPRIRVQLADWKRSWPAWPPWPFSSRPSGVRAKRLPPPAPLRPWAKRWRYLGRWLGEALPRAARRNAAKTAVAALFASHALPDRPWAVLGLTCWVYALPTSPAAPDESWSDVARRLVLDVLGVGEHEPALAPVRNLRVVGSTSDSVALEWQSAQRDFYVAATQGDESAAARVKAHPLRSAPGPELLLVLAAVLRSHPLVGVFLALVGALAFEAPADDATVRVTLRGLASGADWAPAVTPVDTAGRAGPAVAVQARTKPAAVQRRLIAAFAEDADGDLYLASCGVQLAEPARGSEQADADAAMRAVRAALVLHPRSEKLQPDVILSWEQNRHRVLQAAYVKALTGQSASSPWAAPLVVAHPPGSRAVAVPRLFPWSAAVTETLVGGFAAVFAVAHLVNFATADEDWWTVDLPRVLQTVAQTLLLGNAAAAGFEAATMTGAGWRAAASVLDWARPRAREVSLLTLDATLGADQPTATRRAAVFGAWVAAELVAAIGLGMASLAFICASAVLAWTAREAWRAVAAADEDGDNGQRL